MSAEMIAIVLSSITLLLSFVGMFVGGFRWMIRRTDARFERFEDRMDARFERFEDRIEARFEQVDARFAGIERELVEIKVAVARIEGPPRRLLLR